MAGRLTDAGAALIGLPAGLPVAVGTGDDFSTPLGGGIAEPGIVANVLGTAEVVGALDPRPLIDEGGLVETHRYVGSRLHYIENPGWVCGGALEWLRALLKIEDFTAFDTQAAEVAIEPNQGFARIFRSRPVLHRNKFFDDAHSFRLNSFPRSCDWMTIFR